LGNPGGPFVWGAAGGVQNNALMGWGCADRAGALRVLRRRSDAVPRIARAPTAGSARSIKHTHHSKLSFISRLRFAEKKRFIPQGGTRAVV